MPISFFQYKRHPKYNSIIKWTKLISITAISQIVVQALGFLSGILIIRLLPLQEYAYYTLANTMLGTISVLSDGGISNGVMAQGGKVWQDKEKLGTVLATGLYLRQKFSIGSLIVSIPILFYLLLHNGASILTSILISLALIPAFYATLSDSLLEIVPKLHQKILPLQYNQLIVNTWRLFLSTISLFVFPWSFVAVIASGIPRVYGNYKLRKIVNEDIDNNQLVDLKIKKEIINYVAKSLPGLIFFCISGQLTIWLISILGKTSSIASFAALNRIGVLISMVGGLFSLILIPRFSRLSLNKFLIWKKIIIIFTGILIFSVSIILVTFLFSSQALYILGDNYNNLNYELVLTVVLNCISLSTGLLSNICSCRGFILNMLIYITLSCVAIIIGLILFELTSLKSLLEYNIFVASCQLIIYFIYTLLKFYSRPINP
jgi:O-antigen/teichoic acid export membrane protein